MLDSLSRGERVSVCLSVGQKRSQSVGISSLEMLKFQSTRVFERIFDSL
jgi:hypothetical protein